MKPTGILANQMKGKYLPILIVALTWAKIASSQTWIAANAPRTNFYAVAYATNGDKVAAASMGVYTSTNFGLDWKLTSAPALPFFAIACSSDGNQIFASVYHGPIYASRDSGGTWNILNTPGTNWSAVACALNGNILLAANGTSGGELYMSTNSGFNWSPTPGVLTGDWWAVALSADGKKLFAETSGSQSYVSTDSGNTWNPTGGTSAFTISSDGQKFIGGAFIGDASGVFVSTNSGISGVLLPLPSAPGFSATIFGPISMSADGLSVIGDELCGALYTSEDGGTNWSLVPNLGGSLNAVAESPNGAWRLVAEEFGGVQISYVPESAPWFISEPIAATNLTETTVVTLKGVALGSSPITFQWQRNGTNLIDDARLTGSATSELTITNLTVSDSGIYTLIATNYLGTTNCETVVTVSADQQKPVVQIYSPSPGEKIVGAGFSAYGSAIDNDNVTGVWCRLNSGPWFVPRTYDNWLHWGTDIAPTNGMNMFSVYAVDAVGNVSFTNSVIFKAEVQGRLSVVAVGMGKVKSPQNNKYLDLGTVCKITAIPDKGHIFTGWSGDFQSMKSSESFRLTNEMNVVAGFVLNPFPALKGLYVGGIMRTNGSGGGPMPVPYTLKVRVLGKGAFVARLRLGRQTLHFAGKLSADGTASHSFTTKVISPLSVQLQLDLTGGNTLTGIVTEFGIPSTEVAIKVSGH